MSLIEHAKRELDVIGMGENSDDAMNLEMRKCILQLIEVFAAQGHSGFSAPYCIGIFEKCANFQPLAPLTGEESEWVEVSEGVFQNNRCSGVFKQYDRFNGQAYYMDGKVFKTPSNGSYTNRESMVPITFPYTPKTEYVEVPE